MLLQSAPPSETLYAMVRTPGFRTQSNTYSISLAPTNRARCRACKQTVNKGEVRVVTCVFVRPGRRCDFVCHAACVNAEMVKAMLSVYRSVDRVPVAHDVDSEASSSVRNRLAFLACQL